jgi:bifunctional DNase/RNase
MGDAPSVEMVVVKVSPYLSANRPLLWLCEKEAACPRLLPIAIGQFEAAAIQMQLDEEDPPRPISYDLFATILGELDVKVLQAVIHSVHKHTFYAKLIIEKDRKIKDIDSRPSDAVALALRTDSPIFVSHELLEQAGLESMEDELDVERTMARFYETEPQILEKEKTTTIEPEQPPHPATSEETASSSSKENEKTAAVSLQSVVESTADPIRKEELELNLLQAKLEQAVLCEEYEAAAQLRDKIELLVNKSKA